MPDKQAEYSARWYARNKEIQLKRVNDRRARLAQRLVEYKATLTCSQCPEDHPATLDFHHLDPSRKDLSIADAMRQGWGWDRIMREIEKCIVLCANCHRKEHARLAQLEEQLSCK